MPSLLGMHTRRPRPTKRQQQKETKHNGNKTKKVLLGKFEERKSGRSSPICIQHLHPVTPRWDASSPCGHHSRLGNCTHFTHALVVCAKTPVATAQSIMQHSSIRAIGTAPDEWAQSTACTDKTPICDNAKPATGIRTITSGKITPVEHSKTSHSHPSATLAHNLHQKNTSRQAQTECLCWRASEAQHACAPRSSAQAVQYILLMPQQDKQGDCNTQCLLPKLAVLSWQPTCVCSQTARAPAVHHNHNNTRHVISVRMRLTHH